MMKPTMVRKVLAILVTMAMVIGLTPSYAYAELTVGEPELISTSEPQEGGAFPTAPNSHVQVSTWAELRLYALSAADETVVQLAGDLVCPDDGDRIRVLGRDDQETRHFTIDLNGHTLNRNLTSKATAGHVVEVHEGARLVIKDSSVSGDNLGSGKITGGYAARGGGIFVNEGATVVIEGGTIINNRATIDGGGIYVEGDLNMTGGSIDANAAEEDGGGVCVASTGRIALEHVAIRNNHAGEQGGGLYVRLKRNSMNNRINNCAIAKNVADDHGGGLFIDDGNNRLLAMQNTVVNENESYGEGGGIYMRQGIIEMTNGSVSDNYAKDGAGGVKATDEATFTATFVTISHNKAEKHEGGGVLNLGTMSLAGCEITYNTAKSHGGGVFNDDDGVLALTSCLVNHNSTDKNGGGIYSDHELALDGGIITQNFAGSGLGNGVYIDSDATKTYIKNGLNVVGNETAISKQEVYLCSGKKLTLNGELDPSVRIGVTMQDSTGVFTSLYYKYYFDAQTASLVDPNTFFFSPEGFIIDRVGGIEAMLYSPWSDLQTAINNASNGETVPLVCNTVGDANNQALEIPAGKAVTLDLAGFTLDRNSSVAGMGESTIVVHKFANLTIIDSSDHSATGGEPGTGTITGGAAIYGGGINVEKGGTLNLNGGAITGNAASFNGGGVYVAHGATMNMAGGAVSNNTAASADPYGGGGGIYVEGNLNVTSGAVTGNYSALKGGGIFARASSVIQLSNATISNNTATVGAGIAFNSEADSTAITGCTIANNRASNTGGGIYMNAAEGKVLTIDDTAIDGNESAGSTGGGIYLYEGKIEMTGGSLSDNTSDDGGGGIMITKGTTFTANTVTISGNSTDGQGGGIKNYGGATLENCKIIGNSAEEQGGGAFNDDKDGSAGVMTLKNCTISDNSTDDDGGGVYSDKTLIINGGTIGASVSENEEPVPGNRASASRGGGIFIGLEAHLTSISGAIVAKGNTAFLGNDLYLRKGQRLLVAGDISGTSIGSIDMQELGTFTSHLSLIHNDVDPSTLFCTDEGANPAVWTADHKEAQLESTWPTLQAEINGTPSGGTVVLSQNYVATSSDDRLMIMGNKSITIDLAGYTLNRNLFTKDDDGHVIEVYGGSTLNIIDSSDHSATGGEPGTGTITGGNSKRGGGIYVNEFATLNIAAGTITGNAASMDGGGIYVAGALNMTGGTIAGNAAGETGGGIYVTSTGTINLDNAIIAENTADDSGGGMNVHLKTNGSISNCTISNNTAGDDSKDYGGGLRMDAEGKTLTITNTNIVNNNTPRDDGGGIHLREGTIVMNGGSLSGNVSANSAGGIWVTSGTTFKASGVVIDGNVAANGDGGGIKNYGTTTLADCVLSGNNANIFGGGAYNMDSGSSEGDLTLTNCSISGNSAHAGGGVYSSNKLTLNGGSITGNSAQDGGGVFVGPYGDAACTNIQGELVVDGNTARYAGNDVFLCDELTLTLTGALTGNAKIGVDLMSGTGVVAEKYARYHSSSNTGEFFKVAKGYQLVCDWKGNLKIVSGWADLKQRIENASDGGEFPLSQDYAASSADDRIIIPKGKTITIDLNGHTLNRNRASFNINLADPHGPQHTSLLDRDGHVIEVLGTLILKDSSTAQTGTITGGWARNGGGINVGETGKLIVQGGTITGNRAHDDGGGVFVHGDSNANQGVFFMEGGAVKGNESEDSGGGICLEEGSKLHLQGGTITGNTSGSGGGIMVQEDATITIKGSPVVASNNAATDGDDVYLPSRVKIALSGALTAGARVGVGIEGAWGMFTSGYSSYNNGEDPAWYFMSPQGHTVYEQYGEAALGQDTFGETSYAKPFVDWNNQIKANSETLNSLNWMSGISGERYLNEINIPGSHDSGMCNIQNIGPLMDHTSAGGYFEYSICANYAETQTERIDQQLEDGARQLDIRLSNRYKEQKWYEFGRYDWADDRKNLWVCHGTKQGTGTYFATITDDSETLLSFDQVLIWAMDFLEKHPTETIILNIRPETAESGKDASIYQRAKTILQNRVLRPNPATGEPFLYKESGSSSYFASYTHMPQLKDCRGKIVLYPNDDEGVGICGGFRAKTLVGKEHYVDPTSYGITGGEEVARIKASYKDMNGDGRVMLPTDADSNYDFLWYWELNCTGESEGNSHYFGGSNPVQYAGYVNPSLIGDGKTFSVENAGRYIGWLRMDAFEGQYAETIWRTNFFEGLQDSYCTIIVKSALGDPYADQTYTVLKGTQIAIPGNIYKDQGGNLQGKYLDCWKAEGVGTKATCYPGDTFRINEDVTFTAQWLNEGEVPVRAVWKDAGDVDKLRPQSVDVSVFMVDGTTSQATPMPLTLTEGQRWTGIVTGAVQRVVPNWELVGLNATNSEGTYGQDADGEYLCEVAHEAGTGYVLTFYHTPQAMVTVSGTVAWDDENDADGLRPAGVTIRLLADGVDTGQSASATADNGWQYSFDALPQYANGEKVEYSIVEDAAVDGGGSALYTVADGMMKDGAGNVVYSTFIDGFSVTNVHAVSEEEAVDIIGIVAWDDADNAYGVRPDSVVVRLLVNGEPGDAQEVTADDNDLWFFSFDERPINESPGNPITYSVAIDDIPGYEHPSRVEDLTLGEQGAQSGGEGAGTQSTQGIGTQSMQIGVQDTTSGTEGPTSESSPSTHVFRITNTVLVPQGEKEPSAVEEPPIGYDKLIYSGEPQALVKEGAGDGGTMMYALGENATTAPETGFSDELPSGTDAQDYFVWYYVKGNAIHEDTGKECVTAKINPKAVTITVDNASKFQSEVDPSFTGTIEGLVDEGDLGEIRFVRMGSDEAIGTYKGVLTAEYTANDNYDVTVKNGDFTIQAGGVYEATSGGTYTKGSGKTLVFTYKRGTDDDTTFDHFESIEVDGVAVPEKDSSGKMNYTAEKGSVIIELQPSYLETLSIGDHTLTALFDDGDGSPASFKVAAAEASPENNQGDSGNENGSSENNQGDSGNESGSPNNNQGGSGNESGSPENGQGGGSGSTKDSPEKSPDNNSDSTKDSPENNQGGNSGAANGSSEANSDNAPGSTKASPTSSTSGASGSGKSTSVKTGDSTSAAVFALSLAALAAFFLALLAFYRLRRREGTSVDD